jgi:hypothetical protein
VGQLDGKYVGVTGLMTICNICNYVRIIDTIESYSTKSILKVNANALLQNILNTMHGSGL